VEQDRNGLRILDAGDCAALLSSTRIGRLAITERAVLVIVPVVFASIDGDLIFSVGPGVLAHAASRGQIVCFEADGADNEFTSLWSVAMTGSLSIVATPLDEAVIDRLDVGPWTNAAPVYVRLSVALCNGRSWTATPDHSSSDHAGCGVEVTNLLTTSA